MWLLREGSHESKTEISLKTRFLEHRRTSTTSSEVSQHIHIESPGHKVELDSVVILDREHRYFERGIKESVYIRALQPSLNRDSGRHKLPAVYDTLLRSHVHKPSGLSLQQSWFHSLLLRKATGVAEIYRLANFVLSIKSLKSLTWLTILSANLALLSFKYLLNSILILI